MTHEDIESTKAPLMEHLIELRSRLIKALIAFAAAFYPMLRGDAQVSRREGAVLLAAFATFIGYQIIWA